MSRLCVKHVKAGRRPCVSLDGTVRDSLMVGFLMEWHRDGFLLCLLVAIAIWPPQGDLASYVPPATDVLKPPSTFPPCLSLVPKADTRSYALKPIAEFVLCPKHIQLTMASSYAALC